MLQDVVTENFWCISDGNFGFKFSDPKTPYVSYVSEQQKLAFAGAFAKSKIFSPTPEVTLFPLIPIQTSTDFIFENFFLVQPKSLETALSRFGLWDDEIDPLHFPPLKNFQGRRNTPAAWLGVGGAHDQASKKLATTILGAIALTPSRAYRYMFSGRQMFKGMSTVRKRGASISDWRPLTPPLMEDICLDAQDEPWMAILNDLLVSTDKSSRR